MKHSSTQRHGGPASLRERAVSRREVLSKSVGAFGAVLGAALWIPTLGYAEEIGGSFPKPIAGGFKPPFTERFIHAFEPERGHEPAFITDFKGFVGLAVVTGAVVICSSLMRIACSGLIVPAWFIAAPNMPA